MSLDPLQRLEDYCRIIKSIILDYPTSAIAEPLELLLHNIRRMAIDESDIREANTLLDELSRSLPNLSRTPTIKIPAEDVKPDMIIAVQGYWYRIVTTEPQEMADGGIRQYSQLRWAGFGARPPLYYTTLSHGLKHGYMEVVLESTSPD